MKLDRPILAGILKSMVVLKYHIIYTLSYRRNTILPRVVFFFDGSVFRNRDSRANLNVGSNLLQSNKTEVSEISVSFS